MRTDPGIETRPYEEFTRRFHLAAGPHRVPSIATIEVTDRCPLNCSHCYNNLAMDDHVARRREMTLEEHCRVVDGLVDAGCFWLLYSGGEIFARRDFLEIYTYAKRRGLILTLFTNATLITEKIADYLVDWRPFAIEVTLYGRTRETYEALTRIPGSFDHCMNGIRLILERGLPLKLKTVGVSVNRHEILDMKRWAEEELGVEFSFDAMVNPRIDCSHSPLAVRLSPEEVVELDLADRDRAAEWKVFAEESMGLAHQPGGEDSLYHCGGGVNSFAIDPYGEMSLCVLSHVDTFNVREGNVREAWDHFLQEVRARRITRATKCTACELKPICGMCPANGELENGDPEAPVDFLCQVAHLRAEVFDLPSPPPHGDCEYCEGGSGRSLITDPARRLKELAPAAIQESIRARAAGSPMSLAPGCGPGGCAGCTAAAPSSIEQERSSA